MNPLERFQNWIGRQAVKAASFSFVPTWVRYSFMSTAWGTLVSRGYKRNSTAYACIRILNHTFPEPELWAWRTNAEGEDEKVNNSPLRQLLKKPNADMGEAELLQFVITYCAIGGNVYLWKQRDNRGRVIALWPFHDGDMKPIPGRSSEDGIIAYYVIDTGDGLQHNPFGVDRFDNERGTAVPKADVVHWKWMIDPDAPWRGIGAMEASAPDIDTAGEIRSYVYSLLKNDAKPPIVINLAEGEEFSDDRAARLRDQWQQRYGGNNRGLPAFLEHGMNVTELGFNLQELEISSLRDGPDASVCMGFGIHPVVVGALVGLKHSTYSNFEEARRALTVTTLVPLWRAFASEMQQAMANEPGYSDTLIRFDLRQVEALQENKVEIWRMVGDAYNDGLITRADGRRMMGLNSEPADDLYKVTANTLLLPVGMNMLTLPTADTPAALPDVDGETPENIETSAGLNGAQIRAAIELLEGVTSGRTAASVAVELLVSLGIQKDRAERMVSAAGALPAASVDDDKSALLAEIRTARAEVAKAMERYSENGHAKEPA